MADNDEGAHEGEVRARPFWSGTITFGLVSIPVELFPANRSERVSLRMVSDDGTPLARRYFCPSEERELDWDEIVRGYEIEKDEFVVVTDEELERLEPEKTRDIDLRRFVNAADIDPMYFERAYYLTPGGNSTKAYRLLARTMEQADRAGIATFVMRGKEYLIAILAENGIMRAETLRFTDELRSPDDIGLPAPIKPKAAAVKAIENSLAKLVEKQLDEDELTDRASGQLLKLVARKQRSGKDVVDAPEEAAEPAAGVIDLMEALKRSLAGNASSGSATRKKAGTKAKAAKAGSVKSATRKSAGKAAKTDRAKKSAKSTKTAKSAKTAKTAKAAKSTKSARSAKPSKSSKSSKSVKTAKTAKSAKSSKPAAKKTRKSA
jgi:DNA end-binding protein Ku